MAHRQGRPASPNARSGDTIALPSGEDSVEPAAVGLEPADGGPENTLARKRRSKTIWAWTSLGLGAACLVTAGVLYGVGQSAGSEAYGSYHDARDQQQMKSHWEEVEAAEAKLVAGHVLVGVGAAAVGFALYQFISRPSAAQASAASTAPRVGFVSSGSRAGLTLSGRF